MRTKLLVLFAVLLIGLAFPVVVLAGGWTLHPAGFGEKSRANWKAQSGILDGTSSLQALYFQKMVPTPVIAAGVAVFKFDPFPVSQFEGLSFYWRTDGWCGAGAPRFNVRVETSPGTTQTFFIGCQAMLLTGNTAPGPNGTIYQERAMSAPFPAAFPGPITTGTVVGLAILFDEGNDVGPGYVYLDRIRVQVNAVVHEWNSASDNGSSASVPTLGPTVAFADEVSDVLGILGQMFPDVPITSWVLYPDVEYPIDLPTVPTIP